MQNQSSIRHFSVELLFSLFIYPFRPTPSGYVLTETTCDTITFTCGGVHLHIHMKEFEQYEAFIK